MSEIRDDQTISDVSPIPKGLLRFVRRGTKGSDSAGDVLRVEDSVLSIEHLTLVFNVLIAVILVVFFLALIQPLVFFPADLLMWEEGDFVGNIIKLNTGVPLYTAPADSNSLIYNPGAFLLTYAVAWVTGATRSVVALRLIQLGFVLLAALIATSCSRKLFQISFPNVRLPFGVTWTVFTFLALFLAATAPHTNKFVYCLHVDAAALLISAFAVWTMLCYAERPTLVNLLIMAACPAAGFATKQFLISLVPVMAVFLLVLRPRDVTRLLLFTGLSAGLIALTFGLFYAIWGDNYIFWTLEVMGGARKQIVFSPDANSISIARGLDHLARVSIELVMGVVGAWWLVRFGSGRVGWALASAWFVLIASETVSSGAGWETLYHFGPAVLLGGVFALCSLPAIWNSLTGPGEGYVQRFSTAFLMTSVIAGMFLAWKVIPTGDRTQPRYLRSVGSGGDLERYVKEIEKEFDGLPPERVLIGLGSWMYLKHDVLQKDRAVSLGDQPLRDMYQNFDITVGRIRSRIYDKVIVHDYHSPYFLYDWADWTKSSGFRAALTENYVEVRTIPAAEGNLVKAFPHIYAGPVSIFVRR